MEEYAEHVPLILENLYGDKSSLKKSILFTDEQRAYFLGHAICGTSPEKS